MSRSYKKYPCWSAPDSRRGIHSGVHASKAFANRKARRPKYWDTLDGCAYKRITDSWDIRDYKSVIYTQQEVAFQIARNDRALNKESYPHESRYAASYGWRYALYLKYSRLHYYYSK